MSEWTEVTCPTCEGEKKRKEDGWYNHPNSFRYIDCETCLGHGIMLAKPIGELKPLKE